MGSELAALLENELRRRGAAPNLVSAPLVIWDGYGLGSGASGVATYGRELAAALVSQGVYPLIVRPSSDAAYTGENSFSLPAQGPAPLNKFLNLKPIWPNRVARLVDEAVGHVPRGQKLVLHGLSNFNIGRVRDATSVKRVLTVHDVIPLIEPMSVSASYYWQLKWLLPKAIEQADAVVCVSEWTRRTVLDFFPEAIGKLHVIRNGVFANSVENAQKLLRKRPQTRLLYVARGEPYKQINVYLQALASLPAAWSGDLVTDERGAALARELSGELLAKNRLVVHQLVSNQEYEALFHGASVYLHASRFEGFCLPVADALRHRLPVVFSRGSATDELLNEKISVGMAASSEPRAWAKAAEKIQKIADTAGFASDYQRHTKSMPTWDDAAKALATLYSSL